MIKVENIETWGFQHAIRGLRNPMNSWDKSDTLLCGNIDNPDLILGKNDLELMQKLYKAGSEHRKYLRQIFVSMDITAPLYWWKEMDTYKVGTVANSCSTMHKIHSKEFELDDFSLEHLNNFNGFSETTNFYEHMTETIKKLNTARKLYLQTGDKQYWWQMIQLLPSSYNQKRTITMNYENVVNIIYQRSGHKLDEWNIFCEILKELPYVKEILSGGDKEKSEI